MLYRASDSVIRAESVDDILNQLVESTRLRDLDRTVLVFFNRPWQEEQPEYGTVVARWQTPDMDR
jgi:hypothetical protein